MRDSEQGLVLRARAGDQAAYGELVTRYQGRVRGWLRSLCGDFSAADDLAQETFLRAWTRLGDLRDPVRFGQWLMKIAYNEFLKSRRAGRSGERLMKELLEQLKGRVTVPTVLFYPGDLDGAAGLRFMGVLAAEHNYRPKIF